MGNFTESLDDDCRALLLAAATPVSFAAGELMLRHGDPAPGAYIVRDGMAEAVVVQPGGELLVVARLGPGDVLGEMALVDRGVCTATVTAREPVTGWFLANEDFRALCAQRDPAARRLHHAITLLLAGRLAALNAQVLACPAAEDRPARSIAGTEPFDGRARLATPPFAVEGFLPRLAFFQRCGPAQVDALVAAGRFVEARRGECIFAPVAGAAPATYVVVRGALEIVAVRDGRERRVAVLGPGQLAGFLGVLRERPHASHAFAREDSLLLEFAAAPFVDLYFGDTRASALLRDAVQRNLLAALGRTNRMLTRLLAQAQLDAARPEERRLNAALHGQLAAARQSR